MRITADTNVLVRAVTGDDPQQSPLAQQVLASAALVAMPLPALCETAWVLARVYRFAAPDIAAAITRLTEAETVVTNRPAVAAGLAMMAAGGDFADGVIAYEGQWLGAETFVSFDRKAVGLIAARGQVARLLGQEAAG